MLLALGVADLTRSVRAAPSWASTAAGLAMVVLVGVLADLRTLADILLLALAAVVVVLWSTLAARDRRIEHGEAEPLLTLGLGLAALIVLSGAASPAGGAIGRWLAWTDIAHLHEVSANRFLLLLGLVLVQLSTGNQLVRLILLTVGAMKPGEQVQPSDSLRSAASSAG